MTKGRVERTVSVEARKRSFVLTGAVAGEQHFVVGCEGKRRRHLFAAERDQAFATGGEGAVKRARRRVARDREVLIRPAAPGGDDPAVRIDCHVQRAIVPAEVGPHDAGGAEAPVQHPVGIESGEEKILRSGGADRAGDDDLLIRLHRHLVD